MKRPRLNPWFRLIIVLTVISTVTFGWRTLDRTMAANTAFPNAMRKICEDQNPKEWDRCEAEWEADYEEGYRWARQDAIGAMIVAAIVTPLLLLLLYGTARWVLAGRREPE